MLLAVGEQRAVVALERLLELVVRGQLVSLWVVHELRLGTGDRAVSVDVESSSSYAALENWRRMPRRLPRAGF